jgi:hypothetical protein
VLGVAEHEQGQAQHLQGVQKGAAQHDTAQHKHAQNVAVQHSTSTHNTNRNFMPDFLSPIPAPYSRSKHGTGWHLHKAKVESPVHCCADLQIHIMNVILNLPG